jgi:lipoprotein signal peptidase
MKKIIKFWVVAEFKDYMGDKALDELIKIFRLKLMDIYFVHNYGTGHTLNVIEKGSK